MGNAGKGIIRLGQDCMKWKRATFNVAVNARAWCGGVKDTGERSGYVSGVFAICKRSWNITHLPSGLLACNRATTLREAKAIVETLAPLLDWKTENPLLNLNYEMRMRVREVILGTKRN